MHLFCNTHVMKWLKYITTLAFFAGLSSFYLYAANENQAIRRGNDHYKDGRFQDAEIEYRRALELNNQNHKALFNLGNALYKQERYQEAAEIFDALTRIAPDNIDNASAFHNLGNAMLGDGKFAESVQAYKDALRLKPDDEETRYNLAYAMKMLQENPPQEQSGDQQNQEGDNDEQEQENQQGQEEQAGQQEQPEEGQQQAQEQQAQQRPEQISKQDAERILDALNQQEQKVLEEMQRQQSQSQRGRSEKVW